jgi:signal peptidase I
MSQRMTLLVAGIGAVLIAVAACYCLFVVIDDGPIHPYSLVSASMAPALLEGDRISVHEFSSEADVSLRRGLVITHLIPPARSNQFVKRLIGLPGDTLEMRTGQLFINGHPLAEPYAWLEDPSTDPGSCTSFVDTST